MLFTCCLVWPIIKNFEIVQVTIIIIYYGIMILVCVNTKTVMSMPKNIEQSEVCAVLLSNTWDEDRGLM